VTPKHKETSMTQILRLKQKYKLTTFDDNGAETHEVFDPDENGANDQSAFVNTVLAISSRIGPNTKLTTVRGDNNQPILAAVDSDEYVVATIELLDVLLAA
jgi:hypothetical protein